ncbi:MAG TPA: tetratricopeptide repeat protein [Bdellovibrionota bacterium]|nr:tetratricopeptide repeat protein [Bdellovibrionota bacterium]
MHNDQEYLRLGKEKVRENKLEEAERYFLLALRENNKCAEAFAQLGTLYFDQGKFNRAISAFQKALQIDPHHTDSAISLSVLYNDLCRYKEAELVFQRAREAIREKKSGRDPYIDEKIAEKHAELGDFYAKYRRYDEALEEYLKAIALCENFPMAKLKVAKVYEVKGQGSKALRELKKLKSTNSEFLPARIQLGLLFYSNGKILDAIKEWETVLDRDSSHQEAQMYLRMARQASVTQI